MKSILPNFKKSNILVIGDVMLDKYWKGDCCRISPEAPVPVVQVRDIEMRPGGAANVALNISSIGGIVNLLGLVGPDNAGRELRNYLQAKDVDCSFLICEQQKTITKLRVLAQNQQLIRLDFEDYFKTCLYENKLLLAFKEVLTDQNVVIFSDYGKGTLDDIQKFLEHANKLNVLTLVDPKGTDFYRYSGASIITPNRHELEAVVGRCEDDKEMEVRCHNLLTDIKINALLVTRGEEGISLFQLNNPALHFSTLAHDVFDVTGAGDTVIAVLGAALSSGNNMVDAIKAANLAAGIVVGKIGTATTTIKEMGYAAQELDDIYRRS